MLRVPASLIVLPFATPKIFLIIFLFILIFLFSLSWHDPRIQDMGGLCRLCGAGYAAWCHVPAPRFFEAML